MADTIIDVLLRLKDTFSKKLEKPLTRVKSFKNVTDRAAKATLGLSVASTAALGTSIKLAADWQKSIDGAARSLDLSGDSLEKFKKNAEQSTANLNFQKSSTEIADLAASIGKLGVASDDIFKYTEAVTNVAIATDKLDNLDKMAVDIAKIGNNFKFTSKDVEVFGAALNRLDDSTAANSTQLLNFTRRVSAFAPAMGLSQKEVLAWGATMISAGQDVESAASFMKNFSNRLAAINTLSVPAQKHILKMGYNLEQLQQDFLKKPNETLITFIERLKTLPKGQQFDAIVKIFGQEWSGAFLNASSNLDKLKQNLKSAGEQSTNLTKLQFEAKAMSNSFQGMMTSFKNQSAELGKNIGMALLPSINSLLKTLNPLLVRVVQFTRTHPQVTKWIVAALGIAAVVSPVLALASGVAGFIAIIPLLKAGLVVIAAMAAPIAIVVAKVAAVAAMAYLIYKNWGSISAFFTNLWNSAKQSVSDYVQYQGYRLNDAMHSTWEFIEGIGSLGVEFFNRAKNWGTGLINGFIAGINSNIEKAKNSIGNFTNSIAQYLPQSDAERGALSSLTQSGRSLVDTFFNGVNLAGFNNRLSELFGFNIGENFNLNPSSLAGGGGGSLINIEMPITITGNVTSDVLYELRQRDRELIQLIEDAKRRLNR